MMRRLILLVALVATVVFGAATASVATTPDAENRVWASQHLSEPVVGPPKAVSAGQRLGNEPARVIQAVATGVAANAGTTALRSVDDVLAGLPRGKQSWVRMVPDEGALTTKFDDLTRGGTPTTWKNFDGTVIERADGVQVGMRSYSGSGGGAIDIRMPDGSRIRLHVDQP